MTRVVLALLFSISLAHAAEKTETAIFAAGCFWCIQPPFDALKGKGVIKTTVGYSGGETADPTYKMVSAGGTGHKEVIEVTFDPEKVKYEKLVEIFWKNTDPYDKDGQFCDKGDQYQSAIYFSGEAQKLAADASKKSLIEEKKLKEPVATLILPAKKFYAAEDYHQDYYLKNPVRYKFYRFNCGRDARLKTVWGESPH